MIFSLWFSDLEDGYFIDEGKKYKKKSLVSGKDDVFR